MAQDRIENAFQEVPREKFLPEEVRRYASEDRPIQIGYGQTNSQPSTVHRMLRWLDVQPGQNILDVGSGSGWTTALLAHLTGPKGRVEAVEKIPALLEFGKSNCEAAGVKNATFHEAGEHFGFPERAPYDRILVSAGADELPHELLDQLETEGIMVIPVGSSILVIKKHTDKTLTIDTHTGFSFVPLRR